jgi:hypothetical protein
MSQPQAASLSPVPCPEPADDDAEQSYTLLPPADGPFPDAAHVNMFLRKIDGDAPAKQFGLRTMTGTDAFAVFPSAFEINETEFSHHSTILVRRGNTLHIGVVVRVADTRAPSPVSPTAAVPNPNPNADPADPAAILPIKRHRSHSPCQ